MIIRYCHIDYHREIAIAAEIKEKGKNKIAGVARILIEPDMETGEFAVAVSDRWQNLGLGTRLTEYVIELAKMKNLKTIVVNTLADNYKMLHMGKKLGFAAGEHEDGMVKLTLELR